LKNNSEQLAKKNSLPISKILIFLISGFLAGFLSLGLSVLTISIFNNFNFLANAILISTIILVFEEELIKFILLKFLFPIFSKSNLINIINGFLFGLGFGLFELILIKLNNFSNIFNLLPILLIHSATSIIIVLAILRLKKDKKCFYLYFLLAILLHLIYNLSIIYYQHLHF
jgi:hypothetical protein